MDIFQGIIVVLFVFAILDLMVGVANDAVNFLNSAIGSKVASWRTILTVASIGILVGTLFSSGMMEVARKGIFNPEMFSFSEIMIVFLAVVITDVLLLDFYNTLRLPTSTTVSIVFELLGAATAIAVLKVMSMGGERADVIPYINVAGASDIASSILLSVGISFSVGLVVQYIARFIFTYDYKSRLATWGGVFGGIAITAITYFLLIKGLKDTTLLSKEMMAWVKENTYSLIGILLVAWTAIMYIGQRWGKWDVAKIVVLVGTFSLAAAFAGNDLVNFIGVSIAGLNSYQIFQASGATDPTTFMMSGLADKVPTQFGLLIAAGVVMVITLWTSRKARGVTDTELSLTKETSGQEDYQPGLLSRTLVRIAVQTYKIYEQIVPTHIVQNINKRFAQSNEQYASYHDKPAFDMIRAAVNLTVASILIAIATSMKLPLSTTYVTFMVAMGTALADGVWGRESAVYRVTGVLTVISGWFLTALSAFVITALSATFIRYGGKIAIGALLMLTVVFLYRTHVHHRKKTSERKHQQALYHDAHGDDLGVILRKHTLSILPRVQSLNYDVIHNLITNKDMVLKKLAKEVEQLALETKVLKSGIHNTFVSLPNEALFHGEKYVQAIDYLRKCATALEAMAVQARDYALNQHPDLIASQQQELHALQEQLHDILEQVRDAFSHDAFAQKITLLEQRLDDAVKYVDSFKLNQLQRIKSNELGVRNTMLYFTVLGELRNIMLYLGKLLHLAHKLQKK